MRLASLGAGAGYKFVIYGHAWHNSENEDAIGHLLKYVRGVLPRDDIAEVYSSAKVVLGTTEVGQEELGMINNRVFEVLSCGGGRLVIPAFDELEAVFKEHTGAISYVRKVGDTTKIIEAIMEEEEDEDEDEEEKEDSSWGRNEIVTKHTWNNRATTILEYLDELRLQQHDKNYQGRVNMPLVGYLGADSWVISHLDDLQAANILRWSAFAEKSEAGERALMKTRIRATTKLTHSILFDGAEFDLILVCDEIGGSLDGFVRQNFASDKNKRIGLVIENEEGDEGDVGDDRLNPYDLVTRATLPQDFEMFKQSISETLSYPKKTARIELVAIEMIPVVLTKEKGTFTVVVVLYDFMPPIDGVWCLWLGEDKLAACVGDENGGVFNADGGFEVHLELNRLERFWGGDGDGNGTGTGNGCEKEIECAETVHIFATINGGEDMVSPEIVAYSNGVDVVVEYSKF